jgi:hypothetical protein
MSAFVVNDDHIRLLVQASTLYGFAPPDLDATCFMLLAENVASWNYRYEENDAPELIEYRPVWRREDPLLFKLVVLKAIHCYEYQSCEHPGWMASTARWFTRQLHAAIRETMPPAPQACWYCRGRDERCEDDCSHFEGWDDVDGWEYRGRDAA